MPDESPPVKMGPVIGGTGDVNVTNVVHTEKDAECAKCGTHCTKGQFSTCQGCRKTFCNLHFNRDQGLCPFCESSKEKSSEAEFLSFLKKTVSDDNKMSGPELIKLKKEGTRLGLEASEINRIIKEFQNKGLKGTTQDLIESARKLYEMGQIAEASERLARFSDEELMEQPELLDLYLRIQAAINPNKLIRFIEEWPVETEERFVAEFCVREDRVAARSVLYALRDRKQDDLFLAERIQICWHLSEIEEQLKLNQRSKLLALSQSLFNKAAETFPAHRNVFQDLCDIINPEKDFHTEPVSFSTKSANLADAVIHRALIVCQETWRKLNRSLKPFPKPSNDQLWAEFQRTRLNKTGAISETVLSLSLASYQPSGMSCKELTGDFIKKISTDAVLGRKFFGSWGEDFLNFMAGRQFDLVYVQNLNGNLWEIPNSNWSGWIIVPNLEAKNSTNLNNQPLTVPHPLTGPVFLSLGKTNKCGLRLEPEPR